jgi:predicted ATPase/DNA-binding winged helix-turn-helix (wHTH) protein
MTSPARFIYEFGPYRVDPGQRVLLRAGKVVPLPPKALDLLLALVEQSGRALSKDALLERLWPDTFVEEGVLPKNVSILRKALGGGAYIETLPKRGYRFAAEVLLIEDDDASLLVRRSSRVRVVRSDDGAAREAPRGERPTLTNLPHQLTSFVGRGQEIADVAQTLGGARLVSLVGPGGIGKTRLALEAARRIVGRYGDGVWLVELAAVTDPAVLERTVTGALGLHEESGRQPLAVLLDHARERTLLLVLDNCEHLVDACAALARALLQTCPNVSVLATSRQALGLAGEVVRHVQPLPVPSATGPLDAGRALACESVALFVDRARLTRPDFGLSDRTTPLATRLCRQLDGIPLAIELAAARLRTLSLEQVVARLDDRFSLLTGGDRTTLARQRTLRAAIDWSYDLLSPEERSVLRRATVFAGGWTLEASEAVWGEGGGRRKEEGGRRKEGGGRREETASGVHPSGVHPDHANRDVSSPSLLPPPSSLLPSDILDVITRLADKSLIVVDERDGEARYRLLDTIREYAREKLDQSDEGPPAAAAHRAWFLALATRAAAELNGPAQSAWLARLETEHDNFRAALRASAEPDAEPDALLELCCALARFWEIRGHWQEGHAWLTEALARWGRASAVWRANALDWAGYLARYQGMLDEARARFEECIAIRREFGDRAGLAAAIFGLAAVFEALNDFERAEALAEEAASLYREVGDARGVAQSLTMLAILACAQGRTERGRAWFEESLEVFRGLGDVRNEGVVLHNIGEAAFLDGDYEEAVRRLRQSREVTEGLGFRHLLANSATLLGTVEHARGNRVAAISLFAEALTIQREINDGQGLATTMEALACALEEGGAGLDAARLAGAAAALRERLGAPLAPSDGEVLARCLEAARQAFGERAAAELEEGKHLPLEAAIEYALELADARFGR